MAPRKKTPTMIWVKKSQQPENMAKPAKEKNKSLLDCSPLIEELPHSSNSVSKSQPSPSTKMAQPATKEHTLSKQDWSQLPEELLHIISENLEDCFDVIHARYSLPSFYKFPRKSKGCCTLEKFPMFLFRVRAPAVADGLPSEFYVRGINRDKSRDRMELLPSPLQCSVKVKIPGSDATLMNILDCQILPLGYQYRMIGWDPDSLATSVRGVAFLPLSREGGKEFVVLISYSHDLLVLRRADMRWMRLEETSRADCMDIVTFRGRFYAVFINGDVFVIDPYSLEATPLMPSEHLASQNNLVPSGNDELFLVERILVLERIIVHGCATEFSKLECRVSRLDEEAGEWVVVTDLGDCVLLIGQPGNSSCSAKELPDGCGVSGNSMLLTNEYENCSYKYGVDTGNAEDDLNFWRSSRETSVTILNTSPTVALRIEREEP